MNEIIQINNEIQNALGSLNHNELIPIQRSLQNQSLKRLHPKLKNQIRSLHAKLNEIIPDDFDYRISLGDITPDFWLMIMDGLQARVSWPCPHNDYDSVLDQLNAMDWDEERLFGFSCCQSIEMERSDDVDIPTRLQKTKRLQRVFYKETDAFIRKHHTNDAMIHSLIWHDVWGLKEHIHNTLESFDWELPDMLTCSYRPVAIVMNGVPLSYDEIDKLNIKAYHDLKGMSTSQASASGRMFGRMD